MNKLDLLASKIFSGLKDYHKACFLHGNVILKLRYENTQNAKSYIEDEINKFLSENMEYVFKLNTVRCKIEVQLPDTPIPSAFYKSKYIFDLNPYDWIKRDAGNYSILTLRNKIMDAFDFLNCSKFRDYDENYLHKIKSLLAFFLSSEILDK